MSTENNIDFENLTMTQIVDALGNTIEYTNAFKAIEELMCPADHQSRLTLSAVGSDELASLVRVVNAGLRRHISEVTDAAVKLNAAQGKN